MVQCPYCGHGSYALKVGEDLEGAYPEILFCQPKLVGYWDPPDPRTLVAPDFYGSELPLVIRYLQSGQPIMDYLGYSYCRFSCGIPNCEMGASDLTDGEWVWPEGLSHYVEAHGVRLPVEFIETMRRNLWERPKVEIRLSSFDSCYDLSFWKAWTARQLPSPS
jgi:hypothetical protein